MLFGEYPVVVRGGGDLATGVALGLHRAGFPVTVLELEHPLAIRRTVSVASAIHEGRFVVEDLEAIRVETVAEAEALAPTGAVPVLVSPTLPDFSTAPAVVVDARLAKRNLDTTIDQASLVVALGPGFVAGADCHAVVETMRGHRLGRVIWQGSATPDTGVPGTVGGADADRVVRAPDQGLVSWYVDIGDVVAAGQHMGKLGEDPVTAPIGGVVRGLISPRREVEPRVKIADIDPRGERSACFEVSDKARLVGAGVLESALVWIGRKTRFDAGRPGREPLGES